MMSLEPPKSIRRVLIVDDDADSCELIGVVLKQAGYDAVAAASCTEGVQLATQGGFDAIILDNWFDQGNGLDLCREIRTSDPVTPIMFYSAAAYPADIDRAIGAGAQAYLVKPNGWEQLVVTVNRLVRRPVVCETR